MHCLGQPVVIATRFRLREGEKSGDDGFFFMEKEITISLSCSCARTLFGWGQLSGNSFFLFYLMVALPMHLEC